MENQFWAVGCGLGWTVGKKGLGRLWATFEACFFTFSGSKKILNFFWPRKSEKTTQKSCSESAQTPFSRGPAQTTAHSPKLISHIRKFRDETSVLLSVFSTNPRIQSSHFFQNSTDSLPYQNHSCFQRWGSGFGKISDLSWKCCNSKCRFVCQKTRQSSFDETKRSNIGNLLNR